MDSNVESLNWSSGAVLLLGWMLAIGVLTLLFQLIKSTRHGATVSTISVPGLFIALGIFCIATPKINSFILQYGENRLKVGKLEREIKEKQSELALIESEIGVRVASANGSREISGVVTAAKNSKKEIFANKGQIVIAYPAIAEVLKQVSGKQSEYWIFQKSPTGNSFSSGATVYDEATGASRTIELEPNQHAVIESLVRKGE